MNTVAGLQATEHLDFNDVSCDLNEGCGKPAAWWAICLACTRHVPACNPCRREWALIVAMFGPMVSVECNECHAVVDAKRPGDLITFVPIVT